MALTRRLVGWILVFDDSQGFVDVVEFERESDARLAYRDLQHPMVRDAAAASINVIVMTITDGG
jgi:hypothetical protein